jgi:CheY-like chemotaxis protein
MSLRFNQTSTRVLVADVDPVIRHQLSSMLKKDGSTPVEAIDGREVVRILQSDADFKAAIFDMMMPYLAGVDVIRYMRTEKRLMRIPVMMITAEQISKSSPTVWRRRKLLSAKAFHAR